MHGIAVMYVYSVRLYAKHSSDIHLAYISPFAILSSAELYSIHPFFIFAKKKCYKSQQSSLPAFSAVPGKTGAEYLVMKRPLPYNMK
jgi:hypothetical protein